MELTNNLLHNFLSDSVLFPALQVLLVIFVVYAAWRHWSHVRMGRRGEVVVVLGRGKGSMARFYGTYVVISGLLIGICLSVEVASNHRVVWVLLDAVLVAYVCLLNPWFRNVLIAWSDYLQTKENQQ